MESDFVTRQHLESLSNGDGGFSEVLNRYRVGAQNPSPPPPQFGGNPYYAPNPSLNGGDAVLLSNMLGQIQAGIRSNSDNSPARSSNYGQGEGFQLNINSDVLKWVGLLLLVLLLVWLFLRVNKKKKTSIGKKIDNLQDEIRTLKTSGSRYNPRQRLIKPKLVTPLDQDLEDLDDSADLEDYDFEDLDDLDFSAEL